MSVSSNVNSASAMLGTLLVLLTLFTSELARRYADCQSRPDCRRSERSQLVVASSAVALVTTASFISLVWVAGPALGAAGTTSWEPSFVVLLLVWLLLLPLLAWQVSLALGSSKLQCPLDPP